MRRMMRCCASNQFSSLSSKVSLQMNVFVSIAVVAARTGCTRLMDSTPPATMTCTPSTRMRLAAAAIALRPDAQARDTVEPGTE